ncbi:hypothetical protein HPB49_000219 [Dermacentor silvarum]|uniref:Uncharacterized protein n=1 Tax=Dermacentor silvarum TaxID=543639 RepID=A0ACB8DHF8_DERSI|nr:hypothetical protein HPB49_000219 [Dermacentor silvarum]
MHGTRSINLKRLCDWRMPPLFFVSGPRHEENIAKFPRDLCHVVSTSSESINAPADRFRRCRVRETVSARRLFSNSQAPHKTFPKGEAYRAVVSAMGGARRKVQHSPDALAVIAAYRHLNNTFNIVPGDIDDLYIGKADMTILPVSSAMPLKYGFFMHAQYPPAQLCILNSPVRAVRLTFIDSTFSLCLFSVSIVVFGGLVAMCRLASCRFGYCVVRRHFSAYSMITYLVCTLLGRGPPTSVALSNRHVATAFWALAMLVLGNYVQTSITAIRSVPCILDSKSFDEVVNDVKSGTPLCLSSEWLEMFFFRKMLGGRLRELLSSMDRASKPTALMPTDVSLCHQCAHKGNCAALSFCTQDELFAATQWSLVPGDLNVTALRLAGLYPEHPMRQVPLLLSGPLRSVLPRPLRRVRRILLMDVFAGVVVV